MVESITGIGRINVGNLRRMENSQVSNIPKVIKPLEFMTNAIAFTVKEKAMDLFDF